MTEDILAAPPSPTSKRDVLVHETGTLVEAIAAYGQARAADAFISDPAAYQRVRGDLQSAAGRVANLLADRLEDPDSPLHTNYAGRFFGTLMGVAR